MMFCHDINDEQTLNADFFKCDDCKKLTTFQRYITLDY